MQKQNHARIAAAGIKISTKYRKRRQDLRQLRKAKPIEKKNYSSGAFCVKPAPKQNVKERDESSCIPEQPEQMQETEVDLSIDFVEPAIRYISDNDVELFWLNI